MKIGIFNGLNNRYIGEMPGFAHPRFWPENAGFHAPDSMASAQILL